MPTCINLPRIAAKQWTREVCPEKFAWISIGEPRTPDSVISNPTLDKLPNLKINFWDLRKNEILRRTIVGFSEEEFHPPSREDAAQIVNFILANKGKNFLVNCAAGVSRSGAVCQFLQEKMGYSWDEDHKKLARANPLLFQYMSDAFDNIRFA
jgi:hypothetical protein